jgi:hypothetical protein
MRQKKPGAQMCVHPASLREPCEGACERLASLEPDVRLAAKLQRVPCSAFSTGL